MDYQFHYDDRDRPVAEFSMDHEAFGLWFTEELKTNAVKITQLLTLIERLETKNAFEEQVIGLEHRLILNREDVQMSPLNESDEEIPEETEFSDEGNSAICGLTDFKAAVLSWQAFITDGQ